ncbi:adhesion G protein-coupled receptor A3-like [Paramacrobiotus metropolitanus]|uniref:adhesion G protein-coupled receptor A3-like n=1 Tax=Paramacrobiotus metropolitanus TaxID=2943436 RepID=UPI0024463CD2|nr:adhesion G protein-coupled receptor A3-like [Paramacrobiotus metropolitanus]
MEDVRRFTTNPGIVCIVMLCIIKVAYSTCPETTGRQMWCFGAELNRISNIMYYLKETSDIEMLDISWNNIKRIHHEDFTDSDNTVVVTRRLLHLNLSHNEISRIDDNALAGLHRLVSLNLAHNKLRTIASTEFHGLKKLEILNLSSNPLAQITMDAFNGVFSLSHLDLSSAPLICNCGLGWLSTKNGRLRKWKFQLSGMERCFTPLAVKDRNLNDLQPSDFSCTNPVTLPEFYISPSADQLAMHGDSVVLTCAATRFLDGSTRLTWHHNGTLRTFTSVSYLDDDGLMTATLTITNITQYHNGNWSCRAVSSEKIFHEELSLKLLVLGNEESHCRHNVTVTNRGTFEWPQTLAKDIVVDLPCPRDPSMKATHRCDGSGKWISLDVEKCPFTTMFGTVMQVYATPDAYPGYPTDYRIGIMKRFLVDQSAEYVLVRADEANLVVQALEIFTKSVDQLQQKSLVDILNIVDWFLKMPFLEWVESLKYDTALRILKIIRLVAGAAVSADTFEYFEHLAVVTVSGNGYNRGLRCDISLVNMTKMAIGCDRSKHRDGQQPHGILGTVYVPLDHSLSSESQKMHIMAFRNVKLFAASLKSIVIAPVSVAVGVFATNDHTAEFKKGSAFAVDFQLSTVLGSESVALFTPSMEFDASRCNITAISPDNFVTVMCTQFGIAVVNQPYHHVVGFHAGTLAVPIPYLLYASTLFVALCLMVMLAIYAAYAASINLPRSYFHVLLNLWFSSCALLLTFLTGFNETENETFCRIVGVFLQAETLCVVNWALAGMFVIYMEVGNPSNGHAQNNSPKMQKSAASCGNLGCVYLFGWGVPAIITTLSLSLLRLSSYASPRFCYIDNSYSLIAIGLPTGLMIFVCLVYFFLLYWRPREGSAKGSDRYAHNAMMAYLALFVTTYCFAWFWVAKSEANQHRGVDHIAWELFGFVVSEIIWGVGIMIIFWLVRKDMFARRRSSAESSSNILLDNRTIIPMEEMLVHSENGPVYENYGPAAAQASHGNRQPGFAVDMQSPLLMNNHHPYVAPDRSLCSRTSSAGTGIGAEVRVANGNICNSRFSAPNG